MIIMKINENDAVNQREKESFSPFPLYVHNNILIFMITRFIKV